ncbi:hypothetical protein [Flavobacterium hungaricum]|uniref:Lipoprotein n=1 Tax=Flavobacterium hungaricum TaxID=2082725 RepID=A0ABR9TDC9_9FLAO|nr:hypothetical protein [Flavobacterium hungaricum]MBE8723356.1 hypothetical protein [Flavobacterium hungaricum]
MKKPKMKSKLYSKNILACFLLTLVLSGCKKKQHFDFYDKVLYYHSNFYSVPPPPDGTKRQEIYYSYFVDENDKSNYENLSQYGFKKQPISNAFDLKIDDFFTNQNPGRFRSDPHCLNCFQDILIFYKNEKIVGIAKFDFKCNRYFYTNYLSENKIYLRKDCQKFYYLFKK